MYNCSKCDFKSETAINFCPQCGSQMVMVQHAVAEPAEPIYTQPVEPTYTQPTYEPVQNVVYEPVAPKKPHLALKIVSMALSIGGFSLAVFTFLYALVICIIDPTFSVIFSFVYPFFYAPFSVVGLALSSKCRNAGDTSAFSKVGKILGIIGVILYGVTVFIGVISLITGV